MRVPIPDLDIGLFLLLLWPALMLAGIAVYFAVQWWQRRYGRQPAASLSYSRRLSARLASKKTSKTANRQVRSRR